MNLIWGSNTNVSHPPNLPHTALLPKLGLIGCINRSRHWERGGAGRALPCCGIDPWSSVFISGPCPVQDIEKMVHTSGGRGWEGSTAGLPAFPVCLGPRDFLGQGTSRAKTRTVLRELGLLGSLHLNNVPEVLQMQGVHVAAWVQRGGPESQSSGGWRGNVVRL